MYGLHNQSHREHYQRDILAVVSTADYYLHAYIHRSKEYSQVERKSLSSHLRGRLTKLWSNCQNASELINYDSVPTLQIFRNMFYCLALIWCCLLLVCIHTVFSFKAVYSHHRYNLEILLEKTRFTDSFSINIFARCVFCYVSCIWM